MRKLALVFAVLTFSCPVFAADMAVKAPPPPPAPVYSWTGWYVGANVGGGWGPRTVDYTANDPASALVLATLGMSHDSYTSSGALGGLQLGYNYQFNRNWLAGVETDFDATGVKGSGSSLHFVGSFVSSASENINWLGTVRARLGYLPASNLLAYATGGFAYAQVDRNLSLASVGGFASVIAGGFSAFCDVASPTCYAGSSSGVATGWTMGGGLEYGIWQDWTIKLEYLYVSLDANSVTAVAVAPIAPNAPSTYSMNGRLNINVARAGLNYRF